MKNIFTGKIPVLVAVILMLVFGILLASGKIENERAQKIVAWVGLGLLVVGSIYLLWDQNALRDISDQKGENKPYSYARVQMWWWTLIILGTWFGVYAAKGVYWEMNSTCLVLLGISAATTVSGRMVDTRQDSSNTTRHQDLHASQGIIMDILSDEHGLSIHRFQAFVFNVAYGLSFVVTVFSDLNKGSFPEYSSTILALLGTSSGTYLAMKMSENKDGQEPVQPVQNTSTTTTGNTTANNVTTTTTGDGLTDANTTDQQNADIKN
ncbi:MAG: hypothetical protein IAF38_04330 [Bacteroidia bacterium]|nr:hypothetical protein [Bacteroidia bacterium]